MVLYPCFYFLQLYVYMYKVENFDIKRIWHTLGDSARLLTMI